MKINSQFIEDHAGVFSQYPKPDLNPSKQLRKGKSEILTVFLKVLLSFCFVISIRNAIQLWI